MTSRSACAALAAAALCASCHSSPTSATTPASLAVSLLDVSVSATGDGATVHAAWTVSVAASGGGTVDFINSTLRDAATGAVPEPEGTLSLDAKGIAAQAGTDHVAAGAHLVVTQGLDFVPPSADGALNLMVTVQATDAAGNLLTQSVTATAGPGH